MFVYTASSAASRDAAGGEERDASPTRLADNVGSETTKSRVVSGRRSQQRVGVGRGIGKVVANKSAPRAVGNMPARSSVVATPKTERRCHPLLIVFVFLPI